MVEDEYALNTTKYYYDTFENTITEVDAKGNSTVTWYDGAGREVKTEDVFDNYHITQYNVSGDGVGFKSLSYFASASNVNAKQNAVESTYDRLGSIVREKSYASYPGSFVEVEYAYDLAGNVVGITDANNNLNEDGYTQTNTYDKLNRLTSSKNANNEIIRNTYDSSGNIKKQTITDSSGTQSILYQRNYDGDGKIVCDTDNAGNSNLYEYDDMGRLINSRDKDSKTNSFGYNEAGTLDSSVSTKPGDSLIARNYAFENPYGADVVYDVRGTYDESDGDYHSYVNEITRHRYSPAGKLIEQYGIYADSTGINNVLFEPHIKYIYDSTGNVISAQYGNVDEINETVWGFAVHYEYDKSRVSKVQTDGSAERNTSDNVNVKYEYYDDGKLKSITYPTLTNGSILKSEYIYDGLSRLTSLTNYKGTVALSSYTYTYDNNGNILTTTETVGTVQNSVAYTYDKLNRISSVAGTKGADSYYEYDARGNRKVNFEQTDFLSEENAVFEYNAEDKLCYAQVGNNTMFADYSANGYRYIKSENSNYPEFNIYDSNGRLHALAKPVSLLLNGSETIAMYPTTQYIWGPDRVLAKIDVLTGNTCYYLYNGHGDVVQIVDTSGNIVNQYDYDVWGNFLKKEETIENHFTYFGQTYDETTGLYYLRARYYDPATSRMLSEDPVKQGLNWYVYCNNNPLKYIDPSGLTYVIAWSYGKADLKPYTDSLGNVNWTKFTAENSFARAAVTRKQELINMGVPVSEIDVQRIDNETDMKSTWEMWAGYDIIEGMNIYSHGYSGGISVAGGGGEFLSDTTKLKWGSMLRLLKVNGKMSGVATSPYAVFHGCNTANGEFAQNFANTQGVTTYAQTGFASFSRNQTWHIPINDGVIDGSVYLYHFNSNNLKNTDGLGKVFYAQ